MQSFITHFITTFWTPLFFVIFLGSWPTRCGHPTARRSRTRRRMPLRED